MNILRSNILNLIALVVVLLLCGMDLNAQDKPTTPDPDAAAFVTPSGKSFHKVETCGSLKRSRIVYKVTRAKALTAGLNEHKTCWRPGGAKGKSIPTWLQYAEVVKRQPVVEKEATQ